MISDFVECWVFINSFTFPFSCIFQGQSIWIPSLIFLFDKSSWSELKDEREKKNLLQDGEKYERKCEEEENEVFSGVWTRNFKPEKERICFSHSFWYHLQTPAEESRSYDKKEIADMIDNFQV